MQHNYKGGRTDLLAYREAKQYLIDAGAIPPNAVDDKILPGTPDIVLPKYKTVIFVNGCFWHKHDCSRFVWPSSNQEYWIPKIQHNVERDKKNIEALNILGWTVITVWECELKKKVREKKLEQLCAEIKGGCVNGTD